MGNQLESILQEIAKLNDKSSQNNKDASSAKNIFVVTEVKPNQLLMDNIQAISHAQTDINHSDKWLDKYIPQEDYSRANYSRAKEIANSFSTEFDKLGDEKQQKFIELFLKLSDKIKSIKEEKVNELLNRQNELMGNYVKDGTGIEDLEAFAHRYIDLSKGMIRFWEDDLRSTDFPKSLPLKKHAEVLLVRMTQGENDSALLAKCEQYRQYLVTQFAGCFHTYGFLDAEPEESPYFYDRDLLEDDGRPINEDTHRKVRGACEKLVDRYLEKNGVHRQNKIDNPSAPSINDEGFSIEF